MATFRFSHIHCPLCKQALTGNSSERITESDGVQVVLPLAYVVERENLIADLQHELAEQHFTVIDHEDG